ncbi:hypothetical protein HY311_00220 [Candidatus Nomurabacteria bacterium]|nr:hypothetical protein [Candidatus Nomurabacteria bacterium]
MITGLTTNVIGTETRMAPPTRIEMAPLYVFATSPEGFTDTVRVRGVVSVPGGETLSQLPPLWVIVVTVKLVTVVAVTESVFAGGGAPPAVAAKLKAVGATAKVDEKVTAKVTGTVVVPRKVLREIVPS